MVLLRPRSVMPHHTYHYRVVVTQSQDVVHPQGKYRPLANHLTWIAARQVRHPEEVLLGQYGLVDAPIYHWAPFHGPINSYQAAHMWVGGFWMPRADSSLLFPTLQDKDAPLPPLEAFSAVHNLANEARGHGWVPNGTLASPGLWLRTPEFAQAFWRGSQYVWQDHHAVVAEVPDPIRYMAQYL